MRSITDFHKMCKNLLSLKITSHHYIQMELTNRFKSYYGRSDQENHDVDLVSLGNDAIFKMVSPL